MNRLSHILLLTFVAVVSFCFNAIASDAASPITLPAGDIRVAAAAGPLSMQYEWTFAAEVSVRAGLPYGFEFGGPLALGYSIIKTDNGSGLALSAGVVDMWFTEDGKYLWTPAVILSTQLRVAHTACLRVSFDITGVEEGFAKNEHPAWWRGAAALLIDMGPYLTISLGVSHQRLLAGEGAPPGTRKLGWVGDALFTIGAVRSQAFEELPTVAVHVTDWLSIIGLVTIAVNTGVRTTDSRYLLGLRFDISLLSE